LAVRHFTPQASRSGLDLLPVGLEPPPYVPSCGGIARSLAAQQVIDDGQTMGGIDVAAELELGQHLVDGDTDTQNGPEFVLVRLGRVGYRDAGLEGLELAA
jgi:hypothetical protein